jgi:hypothetical protein
MKRDWDKSNYGAPYTDKIKTHMYVATVIHLTLQRIW